MEKLLSGLNFGATETKGEEEEKEKGGGEKRGGQTGDSQLVLAAGVRKGGGINNPKLSFGDERKADKDYYYIMKMQTDVKQTLNDRSR